MVKAPVTSATSLLLTIIPVLNSTMMDYGRDRVVYAAMRLITKTFGSRKVPKARDESL